MKNYFEDVDVMKICLTHAEDYEFYIHTEKAAFKKDSVLVKKEDIESQKELYDDLRKELIMCKEMLRQFLKKEIIITDDDATSQNESEIDSMIKSAKTSADDTNMMRTHEQLKDKLKQQVLNEEER